MRVEGLQTEPGSWPRWWRPRGRRSAGRSPRKSWPKRPRSWWWPRPGSSRERVPAPHVATTVRTTLPRDQRHVDGRAGTRTRRTLPSDRRSPHACIAEQLGKPTGVLIVDDTGFVKKSTTAAGVRRQYSSTADGRELPDLSLRRLCDHLPLPKSWTGGEERCQAARLPDDRGFATTGWINSVGQPCSPDAPSGQEPTALDEQPSIAPAEPLPIDASASGGKSTRTPAGHRRGELSGAVLRRPADHGRLTVRGRLGDRHNHRRHSVRRSRDSPFTSAKRR